MRIGLTLAILALVLIACGGGTPSETKLTANANGKTIDLTLNQTLVLTLDSNATTWATNAISSPSRRHRSSSLSHRTIMRRKRTGGMVGVGGTETWKFQAVVSAKQLSNSAISVPSIRKMSAANSH